MLASHVAFLFAFSLAFCLHHGETVKPAKINGGPANTDVENLAGNITDGLKNSKVLGPPFTIHDPHDVILRVSNRLLAKAGINDPSLAEVAAQAGKAVGDIKSEVLIKTIGQEMAKFLDNAGLVSSDSVIPLSNMVVKSIELEACTNGVSDPESVANAFVFGKHAVMDALKLVNKDKMVELFHLFSEEIKNQSKKASFELLYQILGVAKIKL